MTNILNQCILILVHSIILSKIFHPTRERPMIEILGTIVADRINKVNAFSEKNPCIQLLTLSTGRVVISVNSNFHDVLVENSKDTLILDKVITNGIQRVVFLGDDPIMEFIETLNAIILAIPLHKRLLVSFQDGMQDLMSKFPDENTNYKCSYSRGNFKLTISSDGKSFSITNKDPDEIIAYTKERFDEILDLL